MSQTAGVYSSRDIASLLRIYAQWKDLAQREKEGPCEAYFEAHGVVAGQGTNSR